MKPGKLPKGKSIDDMLDYHEAANWMGVSVEKLRILVNTGKVKALRLGNNLVRIVPRQVIEDKSLQA